MSLQKVARFLVKYAGPIHDEMVGMAGERLFGPGASIANLAGTVAGLSEKDLTAEDLKTINDNTVTSMIPGVTAYRRARRRKLLHDLVAKDGAKSSTKIQLSELLGIPLTAIGGSLAGAGIGDVLARFGTRGKSDAERQMARFLSRRFGAVAGATIPVGIAALAALARRRRTLTEQADYENNPRTPLKNMTIPGLALYNHYKGIGATDHLTGMTDEDLEELKKTGSFNLKKKAFTLPELLIAATPTIAGMGYTINRAGHAATRDKDTPVSMGRIATDIAGTGAAAAVPTALGFVAGYSELGDKYFDKKLKPKHRNLSHIADRAGILGVGPATTSSAVAKKMYRNFGRIRNLYGAAGAAGLGALFALPGLYATIKDIKQRRNWKKNQVVKTNKK